ncbi:MAG: amino acid decarboxylase, partial [Actinomycetota bacterium]|nr:amino acid decarboxylase [Actinomycetota bacterium]
MTKVVSAPESRRLRAAHHAGSQPAAATPYLDAVRRYADGAPARLTVPGHKGGLAAPVSLLRELIGGAAALDVPQLIEGVDRETGRLSPFELAERRAAAAWGAARTWFLTGGATQGNLAACLAVASAGRGRRAAVQRSSHSSTFNGVTLAGLHPTTVMPEVDGRLGIAHGVTPAAL